MKIGIRAHDLYKGDIDSLFKSLKENGFNYTQLVTYKAIDTSKLIVFLLLLLFGLLFIILSILGNYLGSIYDQSKQRPLYILKEEINNDE